MQNRYAGDIGDFTKFYLIKRIQQIRGYRDGEFGLQWYLNDRPEQNGDGHKTGFLKDPFHLKLDALLAEDLQSTLARRSIAALEANVRLPSKVVFFSAPVASGEPARGQWHSSALEKLNSCNAILLDPDNGFRPPSAKGKRLAKYVLEDEIKDYVENMELTIVYQHFSRRRRDQRLEEISAFLKRSVEQPFDHIVFSRAARYYVLIARDSGLLETIAHSVNPAGTDYFQKEELHVVGN